MGHLLFIDSMECDPDLTDRHLLISDIRYKDLYTLSCDLKKVQLKDKFA